MADCPPGSRPPVNVDLIRQRAKEIRDSVAVLERYARLPVEEFLGRGEAIDAAKYRLVVAIEAAVSICNHLAARLASRTPESYADCFSVLSDARLLPRDLADRLGRMARFRNLLVHLYWRVDDRLVWESLSTGLPDLERYLAAVGDVIGVEP